MKKFLLLAILVGLGFRRGKAVAQRRLKFALPDPAA